MDTSELVFRHADLGGGPISSVRIRAGCVVDVDTTDELSGTDVIDCDGGALLPGLHDHHLHLLATAALDSSVDCGPPSVLSRADLSAALRDAPFHNGWIRGTGYDDGRVGLLDRYDLDEARADVPVRVQHRGGSLWVVNSAGVRALTLDGAGRPGVERDETGHPTGRLWRMDEWMRERLGHEDPPDLGPFSRRLASYGITGVTDATPDLDDGSIRLLANGAVLQHVLLLGTPTGDSPVKLICSDHELPRLDELTRWIRAARPRPVAIHCVTAAALALTLAALDDSGVTPGDRIEHAAVASPELAGRMAEAGIIVVTQPSLVARRGDDYLERVDQRDHDHLWPFASLLRAGVRVACSSDAPYGDPDPWASIAAAARRESPSGRLVAPAERVLPRVALDAFLTPLENPGGAPRRIQEGAAADLVLLDSPLQTALERPTAERVRMTFIDGALVYSSAAGTAP